MAVKYISFKCINIFDKMYISGPANNEIYNAGLL